ncbi:hypothetical protein Oweho_1147 [Owenweeksia hongkongensis DSM 17368]|uniref:Uncharacterized protein n=1 Tax=Owenweeksia hongkongensis (strain DSM 17368 / CIP 108786 / JCM 12287 / NRRL B-23963 / UST20020801) TaxID=926562 RepID=G8R5A7_OWEHD|nr:hypothetical protein [Owenweeksia hongkongensis]AEV32152.1 hypothetical protein Oweho_1147 [Owenweeksia hongkongensis DSM 17368]
MFLEKHFTYKSEKAPEEILVELEEKITTSKQFNFRITAKELGPKFYITKKRTLFSPSGNTSFSQIEGEVKDLKVSIRISGGMIPEAVVFFMSMVLIFFGFGYADSQEWYIIILLIFPLIIVYLGMRLQVSSEIDYLERKLKELIDIE